jgi:hypothetical protein
MKDHKHVLVLNGRHYNAKTGENLSHPGEPTHAKRASHHAPAPKPPEPSPRAAGRRPARQAAHHVKPHAPAASRTLMRRGLKKPEASVKRRIRVSGRLDSQMKQPDTTPARAGGRRGTVKIRQARRISHFSPNLFTTVTHVTVVREQPLVSDRPPAPRRKPTTAELFDYAVAHAPEPEAPSHHKRARRHLRRRTRAVAH